jgi:hypothetical protein
MQLPTILLKGVTVLGHVEIVVPEGADSAQLTELYRRALRDKYGDTPHTPSLGKLQELTPSVRE